MKSFEVEALVSEFTTTFDAHVMAGKKCVDAAGSQKVGPAVLAYVDQMQRALTAYRTGAMAMFGEMDKRSDEAVDAAVNMQAKAAGVFTPEVVK